MNNGAVPTRVINNGTNNTLLFTSGDVYTERSVIDIVSGSDSLSDTAPLRALIAKYVTEKELVKIRKTLH